MYVVQSCSSHWGIGHHDFSAPCGSAYEKCTADHKNKLKTGQMEVWGAHPLITGSEGRKSKDDTGGRMDIHISIQVPCLSFLISALDTATSQLSLLHHQHVIQQFPRPDTEHGQTQRSTKHTSRAECFQQVWKTAEHPGDQSPKLPRQYHYQAGYAYD